MIAKTKGIYDLRFAIDEWSAQLDFSRYFIHHSPFKIHHLQFVYYLSGIATWLRHVVNDKAIGFEGR